MFGAALQGLQDRTRLCVASGLTLSTQSVRCMTVAQWRQMATGPSAQIPAVFALGV